MQDTQNMATSKISSEQSTFSAKHSSPTQSTEKGGEAAKRDVSKGLIEEDVVYREPLLDM